MHQQAGGIDFGSHVGKLELNGLKLGDWFSELLPLLGILQRGFVSTLRHADCQRSDADTPAVEDFQSIDETAARRAEQIFLRYAAIVEDHRGSIAGAQAQLV